MSKTLLLAAAFGAATLPAVLGEVKPSALFSDNAVLEQGRPTPIWGRADPGEKVTVQFAGQEKTVAAGAQDGRWEVTLDPLAASQEGRTLTIQGANTVTAKNVMVGEVWLASGQSNMAFTLSNAHDAATEIPTADDAALRFFSVKRRTAAAPVTELEGKWEICTPATAKGFSAAAYFFARDLRAKLQRPVGVVASAWGGTPAQAWTSLPGLRAQPLLQKYVQQWDAAYAKYQEVQANPQRAADYERELKQWQAEVAPAFNAAVKEYNRAKDAGENVGPKPAPARPEPANPDPMGIPSPSARPSTPSVIFNGMIAPLAPYALSGVIWYQGEANGGAGWEYRTLFPTLIESWRSQWHRNDLPFLYVQLPGWNHDTQPVERHDWPWLREAQLLTLRLPKTGMAVAIDVGDPNNVHPADKSDVGKRLALVARGVVYGEPIVWSGPLYQSAQADGAAMRVKFTSTGSGLTAGEAPWRAAKVEPMPTDRLIGFAIAGADRRWVEASARIEGDTVVVSSAEVPQPAAVRYGWANAPRCNLYNREGLPASPFRTDDWPVPGAEKRP